MKSGSASVARLAAVKIPRVRCVNDQTLLNDRFLAKQRTFASLVILILLHGFASLFRSLFAATPLVAEMSDKHLGQNQRGS